MEGAKAASGAGGGAPTPWRAILLALPVWGALVWRFDFLCDDAYIFFRYAVHLADGEGLRFNPGSHVPVEGYSSLLWTLALAGFAALDLAPTVVSRVLSVACGALLLAQVVRFAARRLELREASALGTALFLALFPPFALWSTSGMETMAWSLASFCAFERLLGDPARPHGIQAALFLGAVATLRVEGPFLALGIVGLAFVTGLAARRRELLVAAGTALALLAAVVVLHALFRHLYHDDVVPNTVRAKGGLSVAKALRGLRYVGTWAVVFPGVPGALLLGLAARDPRHRALRLQCVAMVAATFAFAVAAGGDFLPMGRFLVPCTPFLALLLAAWVGEARGGRARTAVVLLLAAVSLLPAYGVHAAPRALREALRFRAGGYVDELEAYRGERDNALDWSLLGRVLDEHTEPGESLVVGGIGAIGYHSELYLHDQFGLVTRARDVDLVWERLNEPGHDRYIPAASFLRHRPTYLSARLARASEPPWTEPEQGPWSSSVEVRTFDLDERSRDGEPLRLELMRLTDWDDFALPFLELAAFVRDVGLDDREEAEAEVRRRARDRARRVERIERELRRLVDSGRVFPSPDPPALRLVTQGKDTLGYRIVALHLAGEIPPTQAPRGAVRFAVALGGEPTLDGEPPGWSVVEPGERLGRRVAGGRMLVVCLSPSVP